jgi:MbtH protein
MSSTEPAGNQTIYKVVMNHEEQCRIWPEERANPAGRIYGGKSGTKEERVDFIKNGWTDMRPLSLRQNMQKAESQMGRLVTPVG